MKKLSFLFFVSLLTVSVFAQENTLLGNGEIENGGFGGPVVKFTSLNDEFALLVGARSGWIINHAFTLGGGGYGLVSDIDMGLKSDGIPTKLAMGYGGLEMGAIIVSDEVLHLSTNLLIGAGAVSVIENHPDDSFDFDFKDSQNDTFSIMEPGIAIELNIATFFRIDAGLSYRFVSGINDFGLANGDLSGPSADLAFRFGKF